MGLLRKLFGQEQSDVDSYTDFGPDFVVRIARSLELPEWASGLPRYTNEEQEAIDDTHARFTRMTDSIARERGGEHTSFHPDLAEPLKRALFEAGLSNCAMYHWKAIPMNMSGLVIPVEVESDACPANWRETASTYLKCYLCNLSPFALLRLAQLLMGCGHKREAAEVVRAVLAFPRHARNNRPNRMDVIAAMSTTSFFADSDFAGLYSGSGGYSEASIGQLVREAESVAKSASKQTPN
jgi:hypothetical protein